MQDVSVAKDSSEIEEEAFFFFFTFPSEKEETGSVHLFSFFVSSFLRFFFSSFLLFFFSFFSFFYPLSSFPDFFLLTEIAIALFECIGEVCKKERRKEGEKGKKRREKKAKLGDFFNSLLTER